MMPLVFHSFDDDVYSLKSLDCALVKVSPADPKCLMIFYQLFIYHPYSHHVHSQMVLHDLGIASQKLP